MFMLGNKTEINKYNMKKKNRGAGLQLDFSPCKFLKVTFQGHLEDVCMKFCEDWMKLAGTKKAKNLCKQRLEPFLYSSLFRHYGPK